jgi:hypothetical protein
LELVLSHLQWGKYSAMIPLGVIILESSFVVSGVCSLDGLSGMTRLASLVGSLLIASPNPYSLNGSTVSGSW